MATLYPATTKSILGLLDSSALIVAGLLKTEPRPLRLEIVAENLRWARERLLDAAVAEVEVAPIGAAP